MKRMRVDAGREERFFINPAPAQKLLRAALLFGVASPCFALGCIEGKNYLAEWALQRGLFLSVIALAILCIWRMRKRALVHVSQGNGPRLGVMALCGAMVLVGTGVAGSIAASRFADFLIGTFREVLPDGTRLLLSHPAIFWLGVVALIPVLLFSRGRLRIDLFAALLMLSVSILSLALYLFYSPSFEDCVKFF